MEPHNSQPNRTFPRGGICCVLHFRRCTVNEVLQHVIQKQHHIFNELRVIVPLLPRFQIEGRKTADCRTLLSVMINPSRQRNFRAQIGRLDFQPRQFVMFRPRVVHVV